MKPDRRTSLAYWGGVICGAASWISFGLAYRFVIESKAEMELPAYVGLLGPAMIVFGIACWSLLIYGLNRVRAADGHAWSPDRFLIAAVVGGLPLMFCIFTLLDRLL